MRTACGPTARTAGHEYACEQCGLVRPDPGAEPRLQRTPRGLIEQLDEARQRRWLGEIERLDHILAAVDDKPEELNRATRRVATVELTVLPRRLTNPST